MATHFYPRSPSAPTGIVFVPWVRPSVRLSIPNDITSLVISAISLRFGDTMRYMYQGADRCLKWPCSAHDDVIKWKHFPRYWPFGRGIHRWIPITKARQWHGALIFSMICAWTNDWVNNRDAGDLRSHRAHYDVIVMLRVSWNFENSCNRIGPGLRDEVWNLVGWCTVPRSRLLFKMAMFG